MKVHSQRQWPQQGFEAFIDYISGFFHLNVNLGSMEACKRYHDTWMARYGACVAQWTEYDVAIWSLRSRQSLKLSFSATYFALSAEEMKKARVPAAASYFAYYSALHAMWAAAYLLPGQSLDAIVGIGHAKLVSVFESTFRQSKDKIIAYDAKELVENLRFLREYYSYRMPLNSPFRSGMKFQDADVSLGGFVKQCIQLANLHSHLLRKTAERHHLAGASIPFSRRADFQRDFFRINGKEHASQSVQLLDPADAYAQQEYLERGCNVMPLSLEYDHMFDDYMTYMDDSKPNPETIAKTRSLVFNALF